jgi:preprotein translocase subunit SecF
MQLIGKTHFDFIGNRYKFFALSGLIMLGTLVSLAVKGVNYGIDFTGGTVLQLTFEKPLNLDALRSAVDKSGMEASLQSFKESNTFALRIKSEQALSAESMEKDLAGLREQLPDNAFTIDRKEFVGPSVGKHLYRQALWAVILSLAGIIVYVAFRFDNPVWGLCGVLAIAHDVLATCGLFSITGAEVDLVIVAALLTIAGYSINDTIVIFDRMRENIRLKRGAGLDVIINDSVNETMGRTLITNLTVGVVVLILFFFGGKTIHGFAMAMVFGAVVGTYSTIAVATPLVYEWAVAGRRKR